MKKCRILSIGSIHYLVSDEAPSDGDLCIDLDTNKVFEYKTYNETPHFFNTVGEHGKINSVTILCSSKDPMYLAFFAEGANLSLDNEYTFETVEVECGGNLEWIGDDMNEMDIYACDKCDKQTYTKFGLTNCRHETLQTIIKDNGTNIERVFKPSTEQLKA